MHELEQNVRHDKSPIKIVFRYLVPSGIPRGFLEMQGDQVPGIFLTGSQPAGIYFYSPDFFIFYKICKFSSILRHYLAF